MCRKRRRRCGGSGKQFHQALAQALSTSVTFGPYATLELQKVTGIARQFGWGGKRQRRPRYPQNDCRTEYAVQGQGSRD